MACVPMRNWNSTWCTFVMPADLPSVLQVILALGFPGVEVLCTSQDDVQEAEGAQPDLAGEGSDVHEEANVPEEGICLATWTSKHFPELTVLQSCREFFVRR